MSDRTPPRPRRTGPQPRPKEQPGEPQANPFVVRLDPRADGELHFYFGEENQPTEITSRIAARGGLVAESPTGIPPRLHQAVNDVLAFIYELDQAFPNRHKRGKP